MKFFVIIGLAGSTFLASPVFAQNASCDLLLKDGLFDYRGTETDRFHYDEFRNWVEQHEFETTREASQQASQVGFNYFDLFSIDFGSSSSTQDYKQWKKDFLNATFDQVIDQIHDKTVFKTANTQLANAYTACIQQQTGVWTYIDAATNLDFVVHFGFSPGNSGVNEVDVKHFDVSHASCNVDPKTITTINAAPGEITCTKDAADQTAIVTLWTTQFGSSQRSPVFPPYHPPPSTGFTASGIAYGYGTIDNGTRWLLFVSIPPNIAPFHYTGGSGADTYTVDYMNSGGGRATITLNKDLPVNKYDHFDAKDVEVVFLPNGCSNSGSSLKRIDDLTLNLRVSMNCPTAGFGFSPGFNPILRVRASGDYRSDPIVVTDYDQSKISWDLSASDKLDKIVDWQGVAFEFHINGGSGVRYDLYRKQDGGLKLKDGPFEAIVDKNFDVHIRKNQ